MSTKFPEDKQRQNIVQLYTAGQSGKNNYFYLKLGLFIGTIYIFL